MHILAPDFSFIYSAIVILV